MTVSDLRRVEAGGMEGIVFNIQHFCIYDGPGIRTTVFLKGCPLSCLWCHNPESQQPDLQVLFYKEKCTGCGRCGEGNILNGDFVCFHGAKELCGKKMDAEKVMLEVLKDRPFYEKTGGGLTLSGGEPLFQFQFSLELLKKAKENGLHTAVETCGFSPAEHICLISEYTDLFLYDYKETDAGFHKKFTGVENRQILENLSLLAQLRKPVVLRCPVIPGYNNRQDHFEGIGRTANAFENIMSVEIIPYNPIGEDKYCSLGHQPQKIDPPDEQDKKDWLSAISKICTKTVCLC